MDEEKYGVKYKLVPDAKALGTKLKKDAVSVRNALPNVSSQDIQGFLKTGEIKIQGHVLTNEEIQVNMRFNLRWFAILMSRIAIIILIRQKKSWLFLIQRGIKI